ncbi:carbon monoxide dehydrogenase subunit G [Aquamicrobium terrae]
MKIENSFTVGLPPAETWRILLDIPTIAPCMPGAELLSADDERTYRGRVSVKLGPVTVAFQGKAEFVEIDEAAHLARVKASGAELKGRGNAAAEVLFRLAPDVSGTRVDVVTDVNLAGAVAQYGRAQGVIAGVAQVLIDQFAANLRNQLAVSGAATGSGAIPASAAAAPAPPPSLSLVSLIIAYIRSRFGRLSQRS